MKKSGSRSRFRTHRVSEIMCGEEGKGYRILDKCSYIYIRKNLLTGTIKEFRLLIPRKERLWLCEIANTLHALPHMTLEHSKRCVLSLPSFYS